MPFLPLLPPKQFARFRALSLLLCAGLAACASVRPPAAAPAAAGPPTELLLLGCDHLAQWYKADNANTDVLTPKRQAELAAVRATLLRFKPEVVMVEELPERQARIDSLYQRYRQNQLELAAIPNGRSENYQLGFALAKELGLPRVYCVNAPGGTSQSILHEGKNIELYQNETNQMRETIRPVVVQQQSGRLSVGQFLRYLNTPATIQRLHHVVYRTAARVTDGTLKPDAMVDAGFINPKYVGAEFVSVMYNRDLKIYSNIVTTQMTAGAPRRMLQIIGLRHVGSLQGIFRDDPAYRLVDAWPYLPRN